MTSRPAAPESETPETDARTVEVSRAFVVQAYGGDFPQNRSMVTADFARSLERRLSLAQTEIKGYRSRESDLDIGALQRALDEAQARIAELEKDAARLDWLHAELKLTIAHALHWPVTPQDTVSFRAKIDAALKGRA